MLFRSGSLTKFFKLLENDPDTLKYLNRWKNERSGSQIPINPTTPTTSSIPENVNLIAINEENLSAEDKELLLKMEEQNAIINKVNSPQTVKFSEFMRNDTIPENNNSPFMMFNSTRNSPAGINERQSNENTGFFAPLINYFIGKNNTPQKNTPQKNITPKKDPSSNPSLDELFISNLSNITPQKSESAVPAPSPGDNTIPGSFVNFDLPTPNFKINETLNNPISNQDKIRIFGPIKDEVNKINKIQKTTGLNFSFQSKNNQFILQSDRQFKFNSEEQQIAILSSLNKIVSLIDNNLAFQVSENQIMNLTVNQRITMYNKLKNQSHNLGISK